MTGLSPPAAQGGMSNFAPLPDDVPASTPWISSVPAQHFPLHISSSFLYPTSKEEEEQWRPIGRQKWSSLHHCFSWPQEWADPVEVAQFGVQKFTFFSTNPVLRKGYVMRKKSQLPTMAMYEEKNSEIKAL